MIETHDIDRHLLLEEGEVLVQDLCLQVDGARHLARHNSIHHSYIIGYIQTLLNITD